MSDERIDSQNAEFAAVHSLSNEFERLIKTAVVDDDYPEVRHAYEGAVRALMIAFARNGRRPPMYGAS